MSFYRKPLFAFDRDICDCLLKTPFAPLIRHFFFFSFSRETFLFVQKEKRKKICFDKKPLYFACMHSPDDICLVAFSLLGCCLLCVHLISTTTGVKQFILNSSKPPPPLSHTITPTPSISYCPTLSFSLTSG